MNSIYALRLPCRKSLCNGLREPMARAEVKQIERYVEEGVVQRDGEKEV